MSYTTHDMRTTYFGFTPTGNEGIDRILVAITAAGNAEPSTKLWSEKGLIDAIQYAAAKLAADLGNSN